MGLIPDYVADYCPLIKRPAPRFVSEAGHRVYGVSGQFANAHDAYHAAEGVRDAGFTRWDVYSPFPIHGIEHAMGIRRTILPVLAFGAGMAGVVLALLMQYYMNAYDYSFVVQGKDPWAWEAYIPIAFELGVLLCAFTCIGGMLMLNGLPRFHHPLFSSERFLEVSDDKLFIAIEAGDPKFEPGGARALLEKLGATTVELIEDED